MIGSLRGKLAQVADDGVLIEAAGVGYRLAVPGSTRWVLPPLGRDVFLWVHTHVREDTIALYGFATEDELMLFQEVIRVSGVGPRLGLTVLSTFSPDEFRRAVAAEDLKGLTRIPGVGKKTAQRLLLELKGKLGEPVCEAAAAVATAEELQPAWSDALEALVSLGYSQEEATAALKTAEGSRSGQGGEGDVADLIRNALKQLGGHGG